MTINPTYLARRTRSCSYDPAAPTRPTLLIEYSRKLGGCEAAGAEVIPAMDSSSKCSQAITAQHAMYFLALTAPCSLGQAPEIQSQYSLNIPPAAVRTKIRQEFERHRYVRQLPVVDMLLFQSHAEFQVRPYSSPGREPIPPKD
jgi:hypothetical protein